MPLSVWILAAVLLLTAIRQLGVFRLAIWQAMAAGAVAVLATGGITPTAAWAAINLDAIAFLFGMFVVGRGLEESGYLAELGFRLFRRARSADGLLLLLLLGMGAGAAVVMNDTIAIIGTPLVLDLGRRHRLPAELLLPALAFAVTVGSVVSPIGNPQNLLIAAQGRLANPFAAFAGRLLLPTAANLGLTWLWLRWRFRAYLGRAALEHRPPAPADPALARLARFCLAVILLLIAAKVVLALWRPAVDFSLTWIALAGAVPLLAAHPRRACLLRHIDWATLVFFAAMFVLMAAVWQCGFFQRLLTWLALDPLSLPAILGVSVLMSQVISNVPMVALYLPVLQQAGAAAGHLLALAAGSTIAGNLLLLGAASNVIIVQAAEQRGETLSFFAFARLGVPLTVAQVAVYWLLL